MRYQRVEPELSLKTCPKCAAEATDETRFCSNCGENLAEVESEATGTLTGRIINGNFLIGENIGSGAMGAIYKAEQMSLGKTIALKLLHRHLLSDPTLSRRFHREARAASRLNHPNIINVIDFGQAENGALFIAMEFVDGRDLADLLFAEFPLTYGRIFKILKQVCLALDEAHAAGIIHRDLKPENIMIIDRRNDKDFVKVLDFGIAKIQDANSEEESGAWQTVAGVVCGTPEYMAPEQARGEQLDARCDLYAIGIILFQLLTNELPFTADSPIGVVTKHLTEPVPDVRAKIPDLHPDVEQLMMRLLKKRREKRLETAMQLHREIERLEKSLAGIGHTTLHGMVAQSGHSRQRSSSEILADRKRPSSVHDGATRIIASEASALQATPAAQSRVRPPPVPAYTEAELQAAGLHRGRPSVVAFAAMVAVAVLVLAVGSWQLYRNFFASPADKPDQAAAVVETGDEASDPVVGEKPSTKPRVEIPTKVAPKEPAKPAPVAGDGARIAAAPAQPRQVRAGQPEDRAPIAKPEVAAVAPAARPAGNPEAAVPAKSAVEPAAKPAAAKPAAAKPAAAKPHKPRKPAAKRPRRPKKPAAKPDRPAVKPAGPKPAAIRAKLDALLAQARKAKSAGNNAQVIATYTAAYKLKKSPRYLKEIGRAHIKSGDRPRACKYFRRYVGSYKGDAKLQKLQVLAPYGCDLGK